VQNGFHQYFMFCYWFCQRCLCNCEFFCWYV